MRYEDRVRLRVEGGGRSVIETGRWGIVLLPFLLSVLAGPAFALGFNANWDYRQSGGEGIPTQNEFRQRYNLDAGSTVTARPSHAITASAGVSYTRSQGNDSRGSSARDELTPYAQVNLMNDIFTAQLSGTTDISTPDDHRSSTSSSWNSSLASSWDVPLWPRVRLNYGKQTVEADKRDLFPDQTVTNRGLSLTWDLLLAQLYYQYNAMEMEVEGSDMRVDSNSQFVRLETGGTFLQNRLRFQFRQNYTQSDQEIYSGTSDLLFPNAGEIFAGITDPAISLDPPPSLSSEEANLAPRPELGDGVENIAGEGLTVGDGERVHLAFLGSNDGWHIDILRLTFDRLAIPSEDQVRELQWNLYLRGAFGWELAHENLPAFYSVTEGQVEILIGRVEQEIMVAAVNRAGVPLSIVEFEAFRRVSAEGKNSSSSTVNMLTNISLGYHITRHLVASGSLVLNQSDFNEGEQENNRQAVSGNLRWSAIPSLVPSLGYSESRNEQTGREDRVNRSYSFVIASIPLPSVNLSFGVTLGEQYLGSLKMNTSKRYTLSSRAAIYPDLSAAALISYGDSERREDDGMIDSDSLSGRLNMNARLRNNLNADLTMTYQKSNEEQDSTQGGEVRTGLRYRPSEVLAFRGAYTTYYGDRQRSDNFNVGATLNLMNTPKMRLTFNAFHYQEEESRQSFSLLGNWKISRNLSLWSQANYLMAEQSVYSFQANLALGL